ncbi:lipopolysaccharide heptosyltransferase I [Piscinibacter sakaiensis]|uniref:Lipopolysaccharide heptosyltransferase 1 n=1 Tax=Piscinibacter sakaiensis TaxID=1547922 RepID=A0A0K8P2R1_PISS1|nr:lipopolysaccharide heptosyltransferase I [Piscinibacter sakaiensis]
MPPAADPAPAPPRRVLIVKLSSLGDVVHAMPVVHDLHRAWPGVRVDWVVEPAFAPLVRRVDGVDGVIECPLRRWRKAWWTAAVRAEWRAFRARLGAAHYDAVIDLQGLTKSAVVARLARGTRHGLANRTEGSSHEWPARWLVDRAWTVPSRIHALDRSRCLVGQVTGRAPEGPPRFGLRARPLPAAEAEPPAGGPVAVFVHGTSRADKGWPEADWVALGRRLAQAGWRLRLPQADADEAARAARIAAAIGPAAAVWPRLPLDALADRLGAVQAVVGVDSGLSHIAVALERPHVQLYNWPTSWRTGPQPAHGHRHQLSVEGRPAPTLEAVWAAWQQVVAAAGVSAGPAQASPPPDAAPPDRVAPPLRPAPTEGPGG